MERIEVTDLYILFYKVMDLSWSEPDFRAQVKPGRPKFADLWYNIEGYLEVNLFLAGYARRVYRLTGLDVSDLSPEQIEERIEVCDLDGNRKPGKAGIYYGSGFDYGTPDDEHVSPIVITPTMIGDNIENIRLFINMSSS